MGFALLMHSEEEKDLYCVILNVIPNTLRYRFLREWPAPASHRASASSWQFVSPYKWMRPPIFTQFVALGRTAKYYISGARCEVRRPIYNNLG
jgi:hypothetical protein